MHDHTTIIAVPIGGVVEHTNLFYRDEPDQHSVEAITGLSQTLDDKVDAAGDSMTGPLILSRSPVGGDNIMMAATKDYVDHSPGVREVYVQTSQPTENLTIWADTTNPQTPTPAGMNVMAEIESLKERIAVLEARW